MTDIIGGRIPLCFAVLESAAGFIKTGEIKVMADVREPGAKSREGAKLFQSVSSERRSLLQKITSDSRSAETTTLILINVTVGVQQGIMSALGEPGPSGGELRQALEKQRPQFLQSFTVLSLASLSLAYQRLDDSALAQYAAFLSTDAGQRFNAVAILALDRTLAEAARVFGEAVQRSKPNMQS